MQHWQFWIYNLEIILDSYVHSGKYSDMAGIMYIFSLFETDIN